MSADAWMGRTDGESVRWSGRPRVPTILPAIAVGLALVGSGVALAVSQSRPLFGVAVLVGVAVPLWSYLGVVNTRFVVTDCALYKKTGVLSRTVRRVSLQRIQNSTFRQSTLGTLFNYGTVTVETAGGDTLAFTDIDDSREVWVLVERQVGEETREVPGTVAQWTAVLEEVQALRTAFESSR